MQHWWCTASHLFKVVWMAALTEDAVIAMSRGPNGEVYGFGLLYRDQEGGS